MWELLISGIVLTCLLVLLWQRVPPTLVSPIYGFIVLYLFTFLGGAMAYDPQFSPAWFLSPSKAEISAIVNDVLWIVSAFIGGVLLAAGLSRSRRALRVPSRA